MCNENSKPLDAYEGNEPYIFVSYAHEDKILVYPELRRYQNDGFNVWFDEGIHFGDEWIKTLAEKVKNCLLFVVFISSNSVKSRYVKREIHFADKYDKEFIPIFLEEITLPIEISFIISGFQSILKYDLSEEKYIKMYKKDFKIVFEKKEIEEIIGFIEDKIDNMDEKYISSYTQMKNVSANAFTNQDKKLLKNVKDNLKMILSKIYFDEYLETIKNTSDIVKNPSLLLNIGKYTTDIIQSTFLKLEKSDNLSNPILADKLIQQGHEQMSKGDMENLEMTVVQLVKLSQKETSPDANNKNQQSEKSLEETKNKKTVILSKKQSILEKQDSQDANVVNKERKINITNKHGDNGGIFQYNSEFLKEFEELNTTTDSIYHLEGHDVLIILNDGNNLTNWDDVENKEDIIYISEDLSTFTDLTERYNGLKSLRAIVTVGETNQITKMSNLFYECSSLVDISNLKSWDTSNVTDMEGMFYGCSCLVDLYALSGWDTSSVTNMAWMFRSCSCLVDLYALSGWDISNVTDMSWMFRSCSSLDRLNPLKDWDVSSVTNMKGMFFGCSHLVDLNGLNHWDTSSVTNMKTMFRGCFSLVDLYALSGWDTSSVTDMGWMFRDCSSLVDLYALSGWDTSNLTNMEGMFYSCSHLVNLNGLNGWKTSNVKSMGGMFYGCFSLVDLYGLNSWDVSSFTDMGGMFFGCSSLTEFNLNSSQKSLYPQWYLTEIKDKKENKSKTNKLRDNKSITQYSSTYLKEFEELNTTTNNIYDLEGHDVLIILNDGNNLTNWDDVENKDDIIYISEDLSNYTYLTERYQDLKFLKAIVTVGETRQITNTSYVFKNCSSLVDISSLKNWDAINFTRMDGIFYHCSSLTNISSLKNWNTSNVTSMRSLFNGCSSIENLNSLHNWNTEEVTTMRYMFKDCSLLYNLSGLSNWDVSKVTTMRSMFNGCNSLSDIGSIITWNTENVTEKTSIFDGCNNINESQINTFWFNEKSQKGSVLGINHYLKEFKKLNNTTNSIFNLENHKLLIILQDGTNLTNYDDVKDKKQVLYISEDLSDKTDLTRYYQDYKNVKLIIANGVTDKVTIMEQMFSGCSSLVGISSLSRWDTSQVSYMEWMFSGCSSLVDISILNNLDTSNVLQARSMFNGCSSLVDISALDNWDVSQVKTMEEMFDNCSSLEDLSALKNWNTSNVMNMDYMFRGCSSLVDISALDNWDVSEVKAMWRMFEDCCSLEDISILNNWEVSRELTMWDMFEGCNKIKERPKWYKGDK